MNRITAFILALALAAGAGAESSAHHSCQKGEWKKKIQSEKIAFLAAEIDITPEEAQEFWPVYNKVENEMDQAMHEVFSAFKALNQALEESRSEKETEKLLDRYLEAQKKQKKVDAGRAERYLEVLPAEKVARLLIGEEKFRRQHIRRLHEKQQQNQANR